MTYKRPETRTLTIASGASTSNVVDLGDYAVAGIYLSAALTSATFGFEAALTLAGTTQTVKDSEGNTLSVASAAAGAVGLSGAEADALAPWRFVRLKTASNEDAARTIYLVLK